MTPSKILIVRLRRIGDVVMTTPAVTLLKKHFPDAALTYLVEEPYRRLVEGLPALDRVIAVPLKQPFKDFIRLIRDIRKERYDVLLDLHGGPRASWITFWSGAKIKAGYAIKRKSFLYGVRVSRQGERGPIHSVQNHANLVRALGAAFNDSEIPPLSLPEARPEEKERVQTLINDSIGKGAKLVVLHIGAGNRFRDWGTTNIIALVNLLSTLPRVKVALIGAAADEKAQSEILEASGGSVLPLAGRLNLIEIRELIGQAALFVGPDSGPMHIAASTAVPIVAYFGPTLPAHFAPWRPHGNKTVILEKDIPCRPCKQRECITNDFRCLLTITPADVFAAARPFLA